MRKLPSPLSGIKGPFGGGKPQPRWIILDDQITSAPSSPNPTTPTLFGTVVYGPAGFYRIRVNSGEWAEYYLVPTFDLASYGSPGDEVEVQFRTYSTESPEIIVPETGQTFAEPWAYTNGNTWTQLDTAYTRTSANIVPSIVTDGTAPNGVRLEADSIASTPAGMYRDDIATAIAGGWTRLQMAGRFRIPSVVNPRGGFGWFSGTAFYGIRVSRGSSSGTGSARLYAGQDYSVTTGTSSWGATYSDDQFLRFRIEIGVPDKQTIRGKIWTGSTEPAWGGAETFTLTTGSAMNPPWLGILTWNNVTDCMKVLGYSVGIDADAPEVY